MLHVCPACRNLALDKLVAHGPDGDATATCPDCDTAFEFPARPLYMLEGAPAVGKSTTAGHLADATDLVICEGDIYADLLEGVSWEAVCALDLRVCLTLHAAGQQALFVGGVHPHDLADSPETRYFPAIHRCALACPDATLEARLCDRTGMTDDAIADCLAVNRWYREEAPDEGITVVDTSEREPAAVASRVASWLDARDAP